MRRGRAFIKPHRTCAEIRRPADGLVDWVSILAEG
jgi:hypothetical protein